MPKGKKRKVRIEQDLGLTDSCRYEKGIWSTNMALTITSNLTEIDDADDATGWTAENMAAGHGIDTDQAFQGNGCYAAQVKAAGVARLYYTFTSTNMEDQWVRIWMRLTELNKYEDTNNGGVRVYAEDSTGNGAEWHMPSVDTGLLTEDWIQYIVKFEDDTWDRVIGSTFFDITDVTKIGMTVNMHTKPARAANMFVDAIRYGPGLTITGTTAITGEGFREIAEADNATANKYGILNYDKKTGSYTLTGKLVFGDSSGTSSVNFSDYSNAKILVPENFGHPDMAWGAGSYYTGEFGFSQDQAIGFEVVGNGTGTTDFQIGSVVGSGDDRQGTLGGFISSQRDRFIFDAETDSGDIDSCYLYGITFEGAGNVKLSGTSQKVIGCTFFNCDEIQTNNAEFLNNKIIAPLDRGAEITSTHDHEFSTYIASGTAIKRKFDYAAKIHNTAGGPLGLTKFFNNDTSLSSFTFIHASTTEYMAWCSRGRFSTLSVNVGTAPGTSEWTWAYWNGSSWSNLDILSDETNGLTTTGQGEVTFKIPSDWATKRLDDDQGSYDPGKGPQLYAVRAKGSTVNINPVFNPEDNYIADVVEAHTHFPSSGNYTINYFDYFGHPASPGYPQWHIENSSAATTQNSYTTANQDTTQNLGDGTTNGVAQSFTTDGSGGDLTSASFYLSTTNNPTGNLVAKLYAHSGTLGTNSIPTGTALATSETVNAEDIHLTDTLRLINFEFEDDVALSASTNYVIALEYDEGNTGNYINVGRDTSSPTHGGNVSTLASGTWTANSSADAIFYVYSGAQLNISATGGSPATKWNSNNSPGATIIDNTVTVTVRAYDTSNSANLSGVRVYLTAASGGSLPVGTEILDPASQTTNAAGLVVDNFNYTSDQPVEGWARQGSASPYHKEAPLSGTITSAGLTLTAPMVRDE